MSQLVISLHSSRFSLGEMTKKHRREHPASSRRVKTLREFIVPNKCCLHTGGASKYQSSYFLSDAVFISSPPEIINLVFYQQTAARIILSVISKSPASYHTQRVWRKMVDIYLCLCYHLLLSHFGNPVDSFSKAPIYQTM